MADGKIRIETKLDNSKIKYDLKDMENMTNDCVSHIKNAFDSISSVKGCESAIKRQIDSMNKAKEKADEYESQLADVNSQLRLMESQALKDANLGIKGDSPRKIQDRADASLSANKDYQKLVDQAVKIEDSWNKQNEKIKQASANVSELETKMAQLSNDAEVSSQKQGKLKTAIGKIKNKFNETTSSSKDFGMQVSKSVDKGIRKLGKMAMAVFGIRTAYTLVRRAANQYMETNQDVSNQVQGMWTTMSNVVGPIIDKLIGYLSVFMSYVNGFIKALTGVDLIANANAKAISNQAKATSKAGKEADKARRQLAGFDEMQVLNNDKSNASGSNANMQLFTPEVLNVDSIKSKLEELMEPMKNAWKNHGGEFVDSFKSSLNDIKDLTHDIGKSFEEVWLNGTGEKTCSLILIILTNVLKTVGGLSRSFKNAWNTAGLGTKIIQNIWDGFNSILSIISTITETMVFASQNIDFTPMLMIIEGITGAFAGLLDIVDIGLKDIIKKLTNADYSGAGKALSDTFINAIAYIVKLIKNVDWVQLGLSIAQFICDGVSNIGKFLLGINWVGLLNSIGKLCIEGLISGLALLGSIVVGIFENMIDAVCDFLGINSPSKLFENIGLYILQGLMNGLKLLVSSVSSIFMSAWDTVKSIFSMQNVQNYFSSVASNIRSAFSNIPDWFSSIFRNAWQNVKNVFSTGGKIFDGIKDGILDGLKTVVNAIIGGINKVIKVPFDGLNSALKKIRSTSILGFKPFDWVGTISVPQIPKLARGGIVNNPTRFIAGEAGKEVVLPLQNNTQWMQDLADFINSQRKDEEGETTINLYIDGEKLFQWFIKRQRKERLILNG